MPDSVLAFLAFCASWAALMLAVIGMRHGLPWWAALLGFAVVTAAVPRVIYGPRDLRRERPANGLCVACGYDLTPNVSGVCPECGEDRLRR